MATESDIKLQVELAAEATKESEEKSNKKPLEIGVYIYIYRVSDVSLSDQRFHAYFHIEFQWEASKEDLALFKKDAENYKAVSWIPEENFVCLNGKFEELKCTAFKIAKKGGTTTWDMAIQDVRKDCQFNLCHYECEGDFSEKFELSNFPLDCQDLSIVLRNLSEIEQVSFVPPLVKDYNSGGMSLESSQLETYIVHNPRVEYDVMKYEYSVGDEHFVSKFSKMTFRIKLERKFKIFGYKIGIFVFVTAISSLIVFTMDSDSLADRYGTLLTLLLTMVAFQFVLESMLPSLPYLTYLDYYIVTSFVFLALMILQTAIFSAMVRWGDVDVAEEFDIVCFILLIATFIIYHLYFLIKGCKARKMELSKLEMSGIDYRLNKTTNVKVGGAGHKDALFEDHTVLAKDFLEVIDKNKYSDVPTK